MEAGSTLVVLRGICSRGKPVATSGVEKSRKGAFLAERNLKTISADGDHPISEMSGQENLKSFAAVFSDCSGDFFGGATAGGSFGQAECVLALNAVNLDEDFKFQVDGVVPSGISCARSYVGEPSPDGGGRLQHVPQVEDEGEDSQMTLESFCKQDMVAEVDSGHDKVLVTSTSGELLLAHLRLGHRNFKDCALAMGVKPLVRPPFCRACVEAKATRYPSSLVSTSPWEPVPRPGYMLFLDPVGPFRTQTLQGDRYALLTIDDYSRVLFFTGLRRVADWFDRFVALVRQLEADKGTDRLVAQLVTDSYPAFVNSERLALFLSQKGIRALHSPPYTLKFNLVERAVRTVQGSLDSGGGQLKGLNAGGGQARGLNSGGGRRQLTGTAAAPGTAVQTRREGQEVESGLRRSARTWQPSRDFLVAQQNKFSAGFAARRCRSRWSSRASGGFGP